MKKLNLLVLLCLFVATFSSCKKDSENPSYPESVPFFKIGNKWSYNVTGGLLGMQYNTYSNEVTSVNGGIYTLTNKADGDALNPAYVYYNNGYINTYDAGDKVAPNQFLYKYPNAKVGDKWTRITPTETYTHEVMEISNITVPAGTFSCKKVHITFKNAFNDQTTYWNDTYGIIKIESLLMSIELTNKNF